MDRKLYHTYRMMQMEASSKARRPFFRYSAPIDAETVVC
jgi:hypothetical protein